MKRVTLMTAPWVGLVTLDTRCCSELTMAAAATTGSTVKCGIAPAEALGNSAHIPPGGGMATLAVSSSYGKPLELGEVEMQHDSRIRRFLALAGGQCRGLRLCLLLTRQGLFQKAALTMASATLHCDVELVGACHQSSRLQQTLHLSTPQTVRAQIYAPESSCCPLALDTL